MAGAGTSWQGIGRPWCGQHKLLSFAGIIAVATVAVVAKWDFLFFFFPACLCGTHYLWPDSATPVESRLPPLRSGSSWLSLFLRMDTTSFASPSFSLCLRQVTLLTADFAAWWGDIMVYCIASGRLQSLSGQEVVNDCPTCPAT